MRVLCATMACMAAFGVAVAQNAAPRWDWNTDGDLQGWGREKSLEAPTVGGGMLRTKLTGVDPWIIGPTISVEAAQYPFLALRIRVAHFGSGSLYWATAAEPQFSQSRMARFRITSDTEFCDCLIDLRDQPEWKGTITQLRLDPIDLYPTAVQGQAVEIDSLAFVADAERPPDVRIGRLEGAPTAIITEADPFELKLAVENAGGQPATQMQAILRYPDDAAGVELTDEAPAELAPGAKTVLTWRVSPTRSGTLPTAVTLKFANHRPRYAALRTFVVPIGEPTPVPIMELGDEPLSLLRYGERVAPVLVRQATEPGEPTFALPVGWAAAFLDDDDVLDVWEPAGRLRPQIAVHPQNQTGGIVLTFREGAQFGGSGEIAPTDEFGVARIRYEVTCPRETRVMAFWGPTVYIGEPGGSLEKQDAVFPGLEWLVGEEQSSSELDVRGPEHLRYVPHPNKVTVPAMGVRVGGQVVGLLWDPRQEWAPGHDRPSAIFAVPDTLDGRGNNLLGLMAPSVPDLLGENQTLASTPYVVPAGGSVRIESYLVCRPADTSADLVLEWIKLFGLPEPTASPRPDRQEALEFALDGYLESLWAPEQNGWHNGLGPATGIGAFWPFMRDVTIAGRVLPEGPRRERAREEARLARGEVKGNFGVETAVYDGGLLPLVNVRLRRGVEQLIATQDATGGWGFDPKPAAPNAANDPLTLGEPGQVELGTCGANALSLLRFARVSRDAAVREAGLKALARMAQFEVPRAGQVWEVPVHTPDVLPAAQSVRAFLEGYRLTGDRRWLAEAVRWAKLGLPFIYLWDSGEHPCMRYGSIPVFGASWYTGAWFGRLVQWNGSEYAAAILELAEYDDSLAWQRIAEGIVASAEHQQAEEGFARGLYTDASNLMDGSVSDFWVAPYHHVECLLRLQGVAVAPDTRVVEAGGTQIAITSAGKVAEAHGDAAQLQFTCEFPDAGRHFVLLADCPEVASVAVGGVEAERIADVLEAEGSAWACEPEARMCEVRVESGQQAEVSVRFEGR